MHQYLYFTHINPRTLIMNSLKPSMNLILLSLLIVMFSDGGVSLLKASIILCLYVGSTWSCNNWLTYSLYSTCQQKKKKQHLTICFSLVSINSYYLISLCQKTLAISPSLVNIVSVNAKLTLDYYVIFFLAQTVSCIIIWRQL